MTREEVLNSIGLKKRFCKDNNLPIAVYDNPYFYERLQTLDIMFDCVDKFDEYVNVLSEFINEQDYFEYYNTVKDEIINEIKASEGFQRFQNESFTSLGDVCTIGDKVVDIISRSQIAKKNLYTEDNIGKKFVSIDICKANFSVLKQYDKKIFFDGLCDTWEDYVLNYTPYPNIINSKYIRQVILGACNPKRQIQYEQILMQNVAYHLLKSLPEIKIYSIGEDEILIEDTGIEISKIKNAISPAIISQYVRVVLFELDKIRGTSGYMKKVDGEVEFKCLSAEIYHQIVKYYYGQEITENDLVFYYNGQLARFLEPVANPWK